MGGVELLVGYYYQSGGTSDIVGALGLLVACLFAALSFGLTIAENRKGGGGDDAEEDKAHVELVETSE